MRPLRRTEDLGLTVPGTSQFTRLGVAAWTGPRKEVRYRSKNVLSSLNKLSRVPYGKAKLCLFFLNIFFKFGRVACYCCYCFYITTVRIIQYISISIIVKGSTKKNATSGTEKLNFSIQPSI